MSNMSYCRFENTYNDLIDCEEHIGDALESGGHEDRARAAIIRLCHEIASQVPLDEIDLLPVVDEE
jgi:hypothetical protein